MRPRSRSRSARSDVLAVARAGRPFSAVRPTCSSTSPRRSRVSLENLRLRELERAAAEAVRELSTPVLVVLERLLIVPLVGAIDADRARQLTDELLRPHPQRPGAGGGDRRDRRPGDRLHGRRAAGADGRGVPAAGRARDRHGTVVGDHPGAGRRPAWISRSDPRRRGPAAGHEEAQRPARRAVGQSTRTAMMLRLPIMSSLPSPVQLTVARERPART